MKYFSLLAIAALVFLTTPFVSTSRAQNEMDDDDTEANGDASHAAEIDKRIEELKQRIDDDLKERKLTTVEANALNRELLQIKKTKERKTKRGKISSETRSNLEASLDKVEKQIAAKEKLHTPRR